MLDFVFQDPSTTNVKAIANPGFTFNSDGSLSQTPANIAAMRQHCFDRPSHLHAQPHQRPVFLGEHSPTPTADYTNDYCTWALEQVFSAEDQANVLVHGAKPQVAIDMAGLGLKEDLIEMEGLDLGTNTAPRPYLDTSQTPQAQGHFHHSEDASAGHDHQHVPMTGSGPIAPSGDVVVDAWIDALQNGDASAARGVQRGFAQSPEGRQLWAETMADAQADRLQQQPWLAQACDTGLFRQAMDELDRLASHNGRSWSQEQREQFAGVIALEARREQLPRIDALIPTRDGGLVAVWNSPQDRVLDRHTAVIDPDRASERPLQQTMQQFEEETLRQEQSMIAAQQRQMQQSQNEVAR